MAVLAFDAEISGVSQAAKTPAAAQLRYEFWRIGLGKLMSGSIEPNGHPLLDALRPLGGVTLNCLLESLNGRSEGSFRHPDNLSDFDTLAEQTILPIYSAMNSIVTDKTISLTGLARAQFTVRRLRGLQAVLNGKKMQLNDFIPTQMQKDRVKLYDIVRMMVEHALESLNSVSKYPHKLFTVEEFCCRRVLNAIQQSKYDLRAPQTIKVGTKHDGLLPLLIYFKSFL